MNWQKNKKQIIAGIVFLVILAAISAGGFYLGRRDGKGDTQKKVDETAQSIDEALNKTSSEEDLSDESLGLTGSSDDKSASSVSNSKLDAATTKQINDLSSLLDSANTGSDSLGLSDQDLGL